ncbi:MAG: hypothetical protein ACRD18_08825 [Terriglobia bacterium]
MDTKPGQIALMNWAILLVAKLRCGRIIPENIKTPESAAHKLYHPLYFSVV